MRSMLFALLLVPALSFAGPPETAAGNGEFCDDQPPDKVPNEPHGGGCEVDVMAGDKLGTETESLAMLHDLKFDSALRDRLQGSLDLAIMELDLDSRAGAAKEEAMLIELAFGADAGPDSGGLLLAISFSRDAGDVALVATWLTTPYTGWSFANPEDVMNPHQKFVSAVLPLGRVDAVTFPGINIHYGWTGVSVSAGGKSQFFAFPSDGRHWSPYRLRNGFLRVDQINPNIGARLNWPMLYDY